MYCRLCVYVHDRHPMDVRACIFAHVLMLRMQRASSTRKSDFRKNIEQSGREPGPGPGSGGHTTSTDYQVPMRAAPLLLVLDAKCVVWGEGHILIRDAAGGRAKARWDDAWWPLANPQLTPFLSLVIHSLYLNGHFSSSFLQRPLAHQLSSVSTCAALLVKNRI